jgi:sulfur-oxidizing protein SoxY
MKRRSFLKGTLAGSTVAVAVSAGLLTPGQVLAAWPKSAFEAKSVGDALKGIGAGTPANSKDISIKAPDIAENGAVVPITVSTGIKGATAIAILAEKNASPLAANFVLGKNAEGYVSTRIKMVKTSNVVAVVQAGGKTYSNKKEVKVTIGGCGG